MARDAVVALTAGTWTQLTADDATKITFINQSASEITVRGAASATAPTDEGGIMYKSGEGERGVTLTDYFPGITAVRVYAKSQQGGNVFVSHD